MLEKEETEMEVKNKDTQTITEMFIAKKVHQKGKETQTLHRTESFRFVNLLRLSIFLSLGLSVSGSVSMYLCIYLCMYLFNLFVFVFVLFSSFRQEEIYKTAWQHSRKKVKYISINRNIKKKQN